MWLRNLWCDQWRSVANITFNSFLNALTQLSSESWWRSPTNSGRCKVENLCVLRLWMQTFVLKAIPVCLPSRNLNSWHLVTRTVLHRLLLYTIFCHDVHCGKSCRSAQLALLSVSLRPQNTFDYVLNTRCMHWYILKVVAQFHGMCGTIPLNVQIIHCDNLDCLSAPTYCQQFPIVGAYISSSVQHTCAADFGIQHNISPHKLWILRQYKKSHHASAARIFSSWDCQTVSNSNTSQPALFDYRR